MCCVYISGPRQGVKAVYVCGVCIIAGLEEDSWGPCDVEESAI